MTEKIIFSGAGGQGIMLMAKVFATAAMKEGKFLTWLPSYGAEVRGGAAKCMLTISSQPIGCPYIACADTLVAMNAPSLRKFLSSLKKGGLLILNSSLIPEDKLNINSAKVAKIAATDIALEIGNIKVANMVALGTYLAQKKLVSRHTLVNVLKDMAQAFNPALFKVNQQAFERGYHG